ncbi:MAG: 50S ribosomal protein L22 [Candidatus Levybacteria bacterium]|nr:50S ribosomal protein L22 [Candidatus Levybacteria bacterium]
MEIVARTKSIRISPRKVRLVADSIRNLTIREALNTLSLVQKVGASALYDTLQSAVGNAINNAKKKESDMFIKSIEVFEGPSLKRFHPSTRGRIHSYKKKSSHIKIVLETKGEHSA